MSLTYEWKLRWLKKANTVDFNNVVLHTHWDCTGTDEDGVSGTFGGSTTFDTSSINGDDFIPYEELTEADVISWVESLFVGDYKRLVDGEIMKKINEKKMEVVEVPESQLPWSTTPILPPTTIAE